MGRSLPQIQYHETEKSKLLVTNLTGRWSVVMYFPPDLETLSHLFAAWWIVGICDCLARIGLGPGLIYLLARALPT